MRLEDGDFVLPVDKPEGPTSHDVVAAARLALRERRIGHTGTLDPFASGLLLLCVGKATRLAEYLSGLDKRYEAAARLGVETDTLDREGSVTSESRDVSTISEADVRAALAAYQGSIEQVPPQYSAKKVDGEAMHRRARRGEEVALTPARVTVHAIELTSFDGPAVRFSVHCSSGTYIRSIARDLGVALGVGAHLTDLRRTSVGRFDVETAIRLDQLDDPEAMAASRIAPIDAVSHLDVLEVGDDDAERLGHGQRLRVAPPSEVERAGAERDTRPVAIAHAGALLGIGELDDGLLRPRKVFPA